MSIKNITPVFDMLCLGGLFTGAFSKKDFVSV